MIEGEGGGFYPYHGEEEEEAEGEEGATQPQLPPYPLAYRIRTPHTVLIKRKASVSPSFIRFQQDADARLARASTREQQLLWQEEEEEEEEEEEYGS
eukprot:evm.model.NODE_29073_length_1197_cov_28.404345.1